MNLTKTLLLPWSLPWTLSQAWSEVGGRARGGHATETQAPMAKLRRTVDPGGSSTHLGQDRKSPESRNRHPTLSELGSNHLHSTFLPAQLQTLKVSEFPKITNFTQPPDRLFMFQKSSRFLNLNSFVNILPRGPRYKSTCNFSSI